MIQKAIIIAVICVLAGCEKPQTQLLAPRAGQTLASDGSATDVQAKVNAASDGDIITLPSGTFHWTTRVNVTKSITILGNTQVPDTTRSKGFWGAAINYAVNDVVEFEGQPNTSFWICTTAHTNHQPPDATYWKPLANDRTVLVTDGPSGHNFFSCSIVNNSRMRISGLTFTQGTMPYAASTGFVAFAGNFSENPYYSKYIRIDHCHVTGQMQFAYGLYIGPGVRGVADHLVYDLLDKSNPQQMQNKIQNGSLLPDSSWCGDNTWAGPSGWGTDDFWYFEDCYMTQDAGPKADAAGYGADGEAGTRYAVRYSHLFNEVEFLAHGMEGGRQRGGRAQEYYNNDYHIKVATQLDGTRSGGLVIHDNTYTAGPGDVKATGYGLQAYRNIHDYGPPWGGATGFNVWDYNATRADGSHVDGEPGYEFYKGTVNAFSRANYSDTTWTCNAANWTTNQWSGYQLSTVSTVHNYRIVSNTANTITAYEWGDPHGTQNPTIGEQFRIGKVIHTANAPCQGQGIRITGSTPTPVGWMKNAIGECYAWNNEGVGFGSATPNLIAGQDYFSNTPMPGYTPLVYPHPLVSGGSVPSPTPSPVLPTPTATASLVPTVTPSPATPTATATATATVIPTTPTSTPTPQPTASPSPTMTPIPSPSETPAILILQPGHSVLITVPSPTP